MGKGISSNFLKYIKAQIDGAGASPSVIATAVSDYLIANPPTVAGDDTAYNASSWNNSTAVPTKNVVRDKFVLVDAATADKVDKVTGSSLVPDSEISKIHALNADNQDLSGKVDKETGKGLSANDLTDLLKTAYDGAVTHAGATHAPTDAVSLATVKGDTDVASAISLKHSNATDHAAGSDAETAATISTLITAQAATDPLDADEFPFYKIVGTALKKVTWASIKSLLGSIFQATLVSATNIKTINGVSVLGAGDLVVASALPDMVVYKSSVTSNTTILTEYTALISGRYPITGVAVLTLAGSAVLIIKN
jgi:hypothetical protein